ncbi:MAG: type VI secretion system baseplate subunit TssG, partial [Bryobacterales bacterium]|nr:type VI secretion system baseplate subunit TssG [Bryobacterales bacterium]
TQFEGAWCDLSPDQHSHIGVSGQNQALGAGVVLGTRVWNQHARITIGLGPMRMSTFADLLPSGNAYLALCDLTALYLGPETGFRFVLTLAAADIPGLTLGKARLGHSSWLKTRPALSDDSQVRLRGKV